MGRLDRRVSEAERAAAQLPKPTRVLTECEALAWLEHLEAGAWREVVDTDEPCNYELDLDGLTDSTLARLADVARKIEQARHGKP